MVTTPDDGALEVVVTDDATLFTRLFLYASDGTTVLAQDGNPDGDLRVSRVDLGPDTYFIEVRAGRAAARPWFGPLSKIYRPHHARLFETHM